MSTTQQTRGPWAGRVALASAVVALTVADMAWNAPGTRSADWLSWTLVGLPLLALLARLRYPWAVVVVCAGALSALSLLGHQGELLLLPTAVALYALACRLDRSAVVLVGVVAAVWSGAVGLVSADQLGAEGGTPVLEMLWPAVPLALGDAARSRRELRDQASAEAEHQAVRRVEAERLRLAREMHDVVAHTIAAMTVQVTAARAAFDVRPQAAREALDQAAVGARDALTELRGTVRLLRGEPASTTPTARLDRLADLVAVASASGMSVAVDDQTDGAASGTPAELVAYRIVQEAVTNAVRHSGASQVRVQVAVVGDDLLLRVTDDGAGRLPDGSAGAPVWQGHGLVGMSERAAAIGGKVVHGRLPDDAGFGVEAVLPLHGGA